MKFRFHATYETYLTLDVEAPTLEAAKKIAEESDGGEWANADYGPWEREDNLTEKFNENTRQWEYIQ